MNTSTPSQSLSPDCAAPDSVIEREVRFAVVIYGGVSLTIYINGIVQEMLNMVLSTAEENRNVGKVSSLTPLLQVYRELAGLVGESKNQRPDNTKTNLARPGRAELRSRSQATVNTPAACAKEKEIHTKFVVDILSGTSAGGINAIYLAKALANNMSIESLARMWITQADMKLLLNDNRVTPGNVKQNPPPSLLNSRWMYLQLLKALDAMNETQGEESKQLVADLDLFCTTTDLRGLPIKIALADESVKEQRYRNVYHFRRRAASDEFQDFAPKMDPFLAFAARCTSSFPFAFEPMTLGDIPEIVDSEESFRDRYLGPRATPTSLDDSPSEAGALFGNKVATLLGAERFANICSIYQRTDTAAPGGRFANRPFGDGGYLDNKPFTYAIETIKKRHATLPVDRKLIYIEPAPEDLSDLPVPVNGEDTRPSAVENSLDALVVLPRYETIRQDIESVIRWNTEIIRLRRVLKYIDEQINPSKEGPLVDGTDRVSRDTYFRLRLSGAADQLGDRLAEAIRVEPSSAGGAALRSIAGVWRDRAFGPPPRELNSHESLTSFLNLFDCDYCERAVRFLRTRLQKLKDGPSKSDALARLEKISSDFMALRDRVLVLNLNNGDGHSDAIESWKQYLEFIANPKFAAERVNRLKKKPAGLETLLSADDSGRDARVKWLFSHDTTTDLVIPPEGDDQGRFRPVPFITIIHQVAGQVISSFAADMSYAANKRPPLSPPNGQSELQKLFQRMASLFDLIGHGKALFERQDIEVYPIIFGTALGEFEPIDIFRISPEDTCPIEGTSPPGCQGNPPLRGASLDAFGAFLDQEWRLSDMLRGRLDGAERLITAVLPDSDPATCNIREELITKAQEAIAAEWETFQRNLNLRPSPQKIKMIDELRRYAVEGGKMPPWFNENANIESKAKRERV